MTTNRDKRPSSLAINERGRLNYLSFRERTVLVRDWGCSPSALP